MEKQSFFAPTVWRLGGACVRRAAMTLAVMLMTVTAWATTVETYYIDADGVRYDVTATVLTSVVPSNYNPIVLTPNQWYVVNSDADISSTVSQIFANCEDTDNYNLILADGKTLTFKSSDDGAINIYRGILNIYGQTSSTGKLVVSASGNAIYANNGINIVGGIVEASSTGGCGISSNGNVTISGGQVSATGDGSNKGISSLNGITLGWRQATDRIYASSYCPDVTIADGQAFLTDDDPPVQVSGIVKYDYISTAIDGKTLRPDLTPEFVQTALNEYTIKGADGWNAFCDRLAADDGKTFFSGKTVKLGANITVSRMADGQPFTGTFDGDGHTLTLAYGTADAPVDAQFVAPFVETAKGTSPVFRNLTIDGTIYATHTQATDHDHVGGLIGHLFGTVTIEDCTSLVEIHAKGGAGGFVGLCEHSVSFTDCHSAAVVHSAGGNNSGFVAWSRSSEWDIDFTGCLFDGKLLQQNGSGNSNGGFIGWKGEAKTVTITNCLCAPAPLADGETMASSNSATFSREYSDHPATITNCYYTATLGTAQGTASRSITAGENVSIEATALTGNETKYAVSGITAYAGSGLKRTVNNVTTLYYGSSDQVRLTLANTTPEGYDFGGYTASAGTLSGSANPYTLTMPDEDVTIGATFEEWIYITITDWDTFWDWMTNHYDDYKDKHFKLGADVSATKMVGASNQPFGGTFDGNGHTLTVNCVATQNVCAPFRYVSGTSNAPVKIKNLHIKGDITTNHLHGAGVIGMVMVNGNVTIENCRSSVDIQSSHEGEYYGQHSGFVGRVADGSTINIKDCVFDGSFNAATCTQCAGFIGHIQNSQWVNVTIKNCLFAPTACSLAGNAHRTFVCGTSNTITNSYYTQSLGGTQGAQGILLYDGGVPATANEGVIGRCINEYDVKLQGRTLYKDGDWNTLCLPFDVTVGSGKMLGATAMTLNSTTSGFDASLGVLTLNFDNVAQNSTITAGTPFIVKWRGTDVTNPVFSGVTVSGTAAGSVTSTDKKVQFVGTYSPVVIYSDAHDNLYLGAANTLYWPSTEDFTLGACRAYFHVDSDGQYEVRAIVLNFGDEDEATGILSTTDDTDFTDSDDAWYDLSGRKLSGKPSQRGVYIRGGRKVAIQ